MRVKDNLTGGRQMMTIVNLLLTDYVKPIRDLRNLSYEF